MNIEEFAKAALEEPDSFYTSAEYAYTTHGRTMVTHRDADVLLTSNWETIKADMLERFPDDVEVMGSSHWAVGWCDELFVRVYKPEVAGYEGASYFDQDGTVIDPDQVGEGAEFTEAFEAAYEWHEKLADYPVADEEDLSRREYEDAIETLTMSYEVPADKAHEVYAYMFETFDVSRSEEFEDYQVREAMVASGVPEEDIPSWMDSKKPEPRGHLPGVAAVKMGTLTPKGLVNEKVVDANACPHLILSAEHYNDDGTCRCDDPQHLEMMAWGYRWSPEKEMWS